MIKQTEVAIPEGYVVVEEYHPCHTVTPWDCYGTKRMQTISKVLQNAGIKDFVQCPIHQENTSPLGSGPCGRVRFGDGMLPSIYRMAVLKGDKEKAISAIQEYEKRVEIWLEGKGPIPAEV